MKEYIRIRSEPLGHVICRGSDPVDLRLDPVDLRLDPVDLSLDPEPYLGDGSGSTS